MYRQITGDFQGSENILYDIVMTDKRHTFAQPIECTTPHMKLWTLGDYDVPCRFISGKKKSTVLVSDVDLQETMYV